MDDDYSMRDADTKDVVRTQKLKEACDMCSASKIKCNKAKPVRSRCEKLGFRCSYSPTRRMGRPHPPRPPPSQIIPKTTRDSTKRLATIRTKDDHAESASSIERGFSLRNQFRPKATDKFREFTIDFDDDRLPGNQGSGTLQTQKIGNEYSSENPCTSRQGALRSARLFSFDNQGNTIEMDGFFQQGNLDGGTSVLFSNAPHQSRKTSSSTDKLSGASTNGDGSTSPNASDEDCAVLAMNMLQDLNMTCLKRVASGTSANEMEMETIDAPMRNVSRAVRCISAILVCPCSQKTDVGLLAAAVCTSILDTYESIFRSCIPRESARVLEELPKVASLVMQFNNRCCEDVKDYSGNLLPALGASLKARLQTMTNEAIDFLARD